MILSYILLQHDDMQYNYNYSVMDKLPKTQIKHEDMMYMLNRHSVLLCTTNKKKTT